MHLELDYYKKSMDWLGSKNNYVIFSDDNQWCKQQPLFSSDNIKFAEDLTNGREELDLCLMSLCDKHIIANSTFSWWGAYLSNQETIIVPDKWFKGSNFSNNNTSDLYPKNWYLVEKKSYNLRNRSDGSNHSLENIRERLEGSSHRKKLYIWRFV